MVPQTLAFDAFWGWLVGHPNCILRAGTPESVLYDDEEIHWHFASEGPERLIVQLIRGKRIAGELVVEPDQVAYVEITSGEQEGEWVFDLIAENESERFSAYYFVLSHGYDGQEGSVPAPGRVH